MGRKASDYSDSKFRSRVFNLLLYPEDCSHVDAVDKILQNFDCAIILHDKDKDDNGDIKKPHWHVVLRAGSNQIWSTSLADNLGITPNYIQPCKNMKQSLLYLIHFNDKDKFQYDLSDVSGSLFEKLASYVSSDDMSESEKSCELISYIMDYKGHLNTYVFAKYCAEVGMWDVYRRSSSIFHRIIDEHNYKFSREKRGLSID